MGIVVQNAMQIITSRPQRLKLALALSLIALPAVIFYAILWRTAVSIPILDDYDIILDSLNWVSHNHALPARLLFLLTREHNGYKLMFENSVVLCQYILLGHVHFLSLVAFGNAFALFIFLIVVCMSRIAPANSAEKWVLLVPIAWLIFQLQYASALNFASSSLQHLAVVFFSLFSIYLLDGDSKMTFWASSFVFVLAIASSPNGFFAGAVGLLMLAQKKRWRRIAFWIAVMAVMLFIYLFRYSPDPARVTPGTETGPLGHLNVVYALSFLGSSAARYLSVGPSLILGIFLCGVIALAAKKRYFLQNPPVFYSMIFIVINAIAVSGLRSDQGVAQSLASRYRDYSNLLLIFSYLFIVESLYPTWQSIRLRRTFYSMALIFSIAFSCLSDIAGARFLQGKKLALISCYRTEWLNSAPKQPLINSTATANPALLRQIGAGIYDVQLPVLHEAVGNGVYHPPQNP